MENTIPAWYGSAIFKKWHCSFPFDKVLLAAKGEKIIVHEPRIEQLAKRVALEGCRILELGCLEGLHSFALSNLGAGEIIAVEGRMENYLKCLIVKNAFHLEKCTFLWGDLNHVVPALPGHFDLCVMVGILYHLEDPVEIVYRLAQMSEGIFIWTHYIRGQNAKGSPAELRHGDTAYGGQYMGEDAGHYLSGLSGRSFWLYEKDLLALLNDAGFKNIEIIAKEDHEHGPAMTLLAKK